VCEVITNKVKLFFAKIRAKNAIVRHSEKIFFRVSESEQDCFGFKIKNGGLKTSDNLHLFYIGKKTLFLRYFKQQKTLIEVFQIKISKPYSPFFAE
jgi:hypothetical protein